MGEKTDQAKGRIKEAIGDLSGDEGLERKGRDDRRAGEAKEKLGHVVDKAKETLGGAKDKVTEMIGKAKDVAHRD